MLLKLFPVLAPIAALIGFLLPQLLAQGRPAIVPLLILVMSFMGLTLRPEDFLKIRQYRWAIVLGMVLQFTVMPVVALCLSLLLQLDQDQTIGMVLVGSVAGGTSSNVMTFLARGNVAMSVSMTALSTLLSVVMTPLIMTLAIGATVPVPGLDMLKSLVQMILLPVLLGVAINHYCRHWVKAIEGFLAPGAVVAILVIIAIVVSLNAELVSSGIALIAIATLLHNLAGLSLGYLGPRLLGFDSVVCRTIAIEVGMQNSGLATALALKFFSVGAALPGAIFSVWLNITGSLFASLCLKFSKNHSVASDEH